MHSQLRNSRLVQTAQVSHLLPSYEFLYDELLFIGVTSASANTHGSTAMDSMPVSSMTSCVAPSVSTSLPQPRSWSPSLRRTSPWRGSSRLLVTRFSTALHEQCCHEVYCDNIDLFSLTQVVICPPHTVQCLSLVLLLNHVPDLNHCNNQCTHRREGQC